MSSQDDQSESLPLPHDLYGRADCRPKHHAASYVWLAYSAFFFIEPIMRNQRSYWLQQLPIFAVFLALYVGYVEFTATRVRLPLIAGMFLLGVVTIPHNVGGSSFFIYVASLLPFCLASSVIFSGVVAVEIVALWIENILFPGNRFNYLLSGLFVVVVGISNLFLAQQKRADARLRDAQDENLALAAVAERERIARDLHDVLGHTLSVIVLKAELAGRLMGRDDARAHAEILDVERTARTALSEVREAIGGYRSKGIHAELQQARWTLDAAGVALSCETRPPVLNANAETVLSLAIREAVTNIVRHAQATTCSMRFWITPDGFATLEVADNGERTRLEEGNGLRGMRERVQQIGGRLRIESGDGTRLVIELPQTTLAQGAV